MSEPDGIHYYVEELPGHRGQLMSEIVAGGRRGDSSRFGSPAPLDSVRKAAVQLNRFPNPDPPRRRIDDHRHRPPLTAAEAVAP